jgi:ribosomal protein S18 acetylase RimI-like enzyme
MGELRPPTPATRPETARPRSEPDPTVEAPSAGETDAIARHLALLAAHSGAKPSEDLDAGLLMLRAPGGGVALNYAARPRWSADDWHARLDQLSTAFRSAGEWPSLLLVEGVDLPTDLAARLPEAGWNPVGRETVLWVGAASVVPHLDPSLRIEAVQPRTVDVHQELETSVFGLGRRDLRARREVFADALERGRLRAWLVRVADEPVAVARMSLGERDAGLYGIGVVESWRGQGMGTLITTVATRAGMALGKRIIWLSVEDTNPGARRMYERLAFRPLFGWSRWVTRDR